MPTKSSCEAEVGQEGDQHVSASYTNRRPRRAPSRSWRLGLGRRPRGPPTRGDAGRLGPDRDDRDAEPPSAANDRAAEPEASTTRSPVGGSSAAEPASCRAGRSRRRARRSAARREPSAAGEQARGPRGAGTRRAEPVLRRDARDERRLDPELAQRLGRARTDRGDLRQTARARRRARRRRSGSSRSASRSPRRRPDSSGRARSRSAGTRRPRSPSCLEPLDERPACAARARDDDLHAPRARAQLRRERAGIVAGRGARASEPSSVGDRAPSASRRRGAPRPGRGSRRRSPPTQARSASTAARVSASSAAATSCLLARAHLERERALPASGSISSGSKRWPISSASPSRSSPHAASTTASSPRSPRLRSRVSMLPRSGSIESVGSSASSCARRRTDAVPIRIPGRIPSAPHERVARVLARRGTRRRRGRPCPSRSCPSPSGRRRRSRPSSSASSSSLTKTPRSPISPNGLRAVAVAGGRDRNERDLDPGRADRARRELGLRQREPATAAIRRDDAQRSRRQAGRTGAAPPRRSAAPSAAARPASAARSARAGACSRSASSPTRPCAARSRRGPRAGSRASASSPARMLLGPLAQRRDRRHDVGGAPATRGSAPPRRSTIASARAASRQRPLRLSRRPPAGRRCRTGSSRRARATAGSTSRGTARSITKQRAPLPGRDTGSRGPARLRRARRGRRRHPPSSELRSTSGRTEPRRAGTPRPALAAFACRPARRRRAIVAPRAARLRAASSLTSAGADEQHAAARQVAEHLLRRAPQPRTRPTRGSRRSPSRVRTFLPTRSAWRNSRSSTGPCARRLVRVAHLAEDLALAGHERVEARPRPGRGAAQRPRRSGGRRSSLAAEQCPATRALLGRLGLRADEVQLGAVAGRERTASPSAASSARARAAPARSSVDALAHLDGRQAVRRADEDEAHAKCPMCRRELQRRRPARSRRASCTRPSAVPARSKRSDEKRAVDGPRQRRVSTISASRLPSLAQARRTRRRSRA